jgi:hypothetical protein
MKIFHQFFEDRLITFFEVSDNFTNEFKSHIFSIVDSSGARANNMLVGEIEEEYYIDVDAVNDFYVNTFKSIIHAHLQQNSNLRVYGNKGDFSIHINSSWVNVMKKNEFNPVHVHAKNDCNLVYWINDFDGSMENSAEKSERNNFYNLKTQEMETSNDSYRGVHCILRNNRWLNVPPRKNFGVIYDWDVIHQVYPFDVNEERLSFVMNMNVNYNG